MVTSVLSSSHFYYLTFFTSEKVRGVLDIAKLFPDFYEIEEIKIDGGKVRYYHLQAEISRLLGSESLLLLNKSERKRSNSAYWYDFYLGEINENNRSVFFICYPYIKLSGYVDDFLIAGQTRRKYIKPEVERVLSYLKDNPSADFEKKNDKIFKVEISKYSAIVKDDSVNKINILGDNPLKSHVYKLLSEDDKISIEPLSLKLKCTEGDNLLDLSFDKFGNMRFWLKRNSVSELYNLIEKSLDYFKKIDALYEINFISKSTILEDEQ